MGLDKGRNTKEVYCSEGPSPSVGTVHFVGYYAASSGNFVPTFREKLQVPFSGVKSLDFAPLKMGPIGCLETSVRNDHHPLCNNSKEGRSLLLRCAEACNLH